MAGRDIVFLVNLLQDVNILRGLVHLALRETEARLRLLLSAAFVRRDSLGIWQAEIAALAADAGAEVHVFGTQAELQALLQGRGGLMIAASESDLNAHNETRDAFRIAPSSYLKITLQHGLECVGFLQSREHVIGHGRDIVFNADVVCGWLDPARLTSLTVAERAKLCVTGPPTLLQQPQPHPEHPPQAGGMVCENMHSVRLKASGDHKASFMDIFFAFCARLRAEGREVTLRPHPGGQYMLKNAVELPANVRLNNLPIYHVNLPGYAYGISAPSTIVLDMVLAGIPVAVWRDSGGIMDAGNYDGLTEISTLEDWVAFEQEARLRPDALLRRQRDFIERLGMVADPAEVYRRFARLLVGGLALAGPPARALPAATRPPAAPATDPAVGVAAAAAPTAARTAAPPPPRRVLFIANAMLPTLQISFLKPLAPLFAGGRMVPGFLTEQDIKDRFGKDVRLEPARDWFRARLAEFRPDLIVCCRYSGPHAQQILEDARGLGVPVIYNLDDDLLNVPRELGERKYTYHNHPRRLETVRLMLEQADLVYASTSQLKRRLRMLGIRRPIVTGTLFCTSGLYRPASRGPVRRVGYMGFDHSHDFEVMLPALVRYLGQNPLVNFELFGAIPVPDALKPFGGRVSFLPPVRDYSEFMKTLASRAWDIGICPLATTTFNTVKSNNKWVEYTACGMATIASRGFMYDECAGHGRGLLVDADEWGRALQVLTDDPELRYQIATRAQTHLVTAYSDRQLRDQVLDIFRQAIETLDGARRVRASA